MKNKEAIEYMENEISCIKTASEGLCNRECSKCDLVKEEAPLIKAYDMAIEALEKQIPKKPIHIDNSGIRYTDSYTCPLCQGAFTGTGIANYCYHCGQKLDWSEEGNTRLDLMRECAEVE